MKHMHFFLIHTHIINQRMKKKKKKKKTPQEYIHNAYVFHARMSMCAVMHTHPNISIMHCKSGGTNQRITVIQISDSLLLAIKGNLDHAIFRPHIHSVN